MLDRTQEWLKQADYDLDTAELMLQGGRYFYAVFMCHLSVEKALKGLYHQVFGRVPPKVHNLVYLLTELALKPPEKLGKFIVRLNEANIATRYPDSLDALQTVYTSEVAADTVARTREVHRWIRAQL